MSEFTVGMMTGAFFVAAAWMGWLVCRPRGPRQPKPHVHDWKLTYMDNAVARYCRSCHEAKIAPYLDSQGRTVSIKRGP